MAQVSAAHAASTCLGSSRSLHLSLRSARSFQQVTWRPVKHWFIEFCLIYCICKQKHRFCWLPSVPYHLDHLEPDDLKNIWSQIEMMSCHLYLILRSESETTSVWEQLHKILAALWFSEECLGLMSLILNCWHWTWKVSMLSCQTKSWPMRLSKALCMWSSNISRLQSTGRKKVTNLLCVGTVCCMWMRAINFWNELWIC